MMSVNRSVGTRERILIAARQQFGQCGYRATTTRRVADQAGVSEPTVFRQFGSKAALFEEAVVDPFTGFIEQQLAGWRTREAGSVPILDETRHFFSDLFDLFSQERSVIPALLAVYHDDVTPAVSRRLEDCMRLVITVLERRTVEESRSRGNLNLDVACLVRIMVAMAFALGTLPRLFNTQRLSRNRIVEEMARLTAYGAEFRGHGLPAVKPSVALSAAPESFPRQLIDDQLWQRIQPLLATRADRPRRGRRPAPDRAVLEGVLCILTTGLPWSALPSEEFKVSGATCWRRHREWQDCGAWNGVLALVEAEGICLLQS
jgi:AcrR family transcriptional regulator